MAIKVKHEGNVTSRIVASAVGGTGRRNAEDSKALAQKAAQENMAANRQLQGAHANPTAPYAPAAQLGHASMQHAPAVRQSALDYQRQTERDALLQENSLARIGKEAELRDKQQFPPTPASSPTGRSSIPLASVRRLTTSTTSATR